MPDTIILKCPGCGTKNRVPVMRLDQNPLCGRCGADLPASAAGPADRIGRVDAVSDALFDQAVLKSVLPVLVDCWAPWCGPCRAVAPVLEELARNYAGRLRVLKLNLDENPGVGSRFRITSVPTLMLVKNGAVVKTLVGAQPKEILEAAIEKSCEELLPEFSDPDFIAWVKTAWGIRFKRLRQDLIIQGSPERAMSRAVAEDREGRLFLVEKFGRDRHAHRMRVAECLKALSDSGLDQILVPEAGTGGALLLFFRGACFQVTRFLDSTGLNRPQWLNSGQMGMNLADFLSRMYKAAQPLPALQGPSFSIKAYIYKLFEDMRSRHRKVHDTYLPVLAFLESGFMDAHDRLDCRFCHGDFHPLNMIWEGERIRAVIDWEFSGVKPDAYDAANLVGCAGIEHPEGLAGPLVTSFLGQMQSSGMIRPLGWQWFPEYVLALRFAWLSEWLRTCDEQMLGLERRFMGILMDQMEVLRDIWRCPAH